MLAFINYLQITTTWNSLHLCRLRSFNEKVTKRLLFDNLNSYAVMKWHLVLVSLPARKYFESSLWTAFSDGVSSISASYCMSYRMYSLIFSARRYSALHGLSYRNSVRPSVRLSHSWTVSTWFDLRSWFLRHMVAPFGYIMFIPKFEEGHPERGLRMRVG